MNTYGRNPAKGLSKRQKRALLSLLENGGSVKPGRLTTHGWGFPTKFGGWQTRNRLRKRGLVKFLVIADDDVGDRGDIVEILATPERGERADYVVLTDAGRQIAQQIRDGIVQLELPPP